MIGHRCKDCIWWDDQHLSVRYIPATSEKLKPGFCRKKRPNVILFKEHHLLTQVAGHGMNVVKLLPPLNLTNKDRDWIVNSFENAIADTHKVPGSIWTLGKNLASHALKAKKEA